MHTQKRVEIAMGQSQIILERLFAYYRTWESGNTIKLLKIV